MTANQNVRQNVNLRDYKDLIETIAKVEYQKFSTSHLIELPELINIGNHTLYILFKNHSPEEFNSTYLSTAIKWAIRNEVRRRYKWYSLKNKKQQIEEENENLIEITDDDGTVIKCELCDIIEFEDKQYALLIESDSDEEEPEVVLMRYLEEGEESYFETIDDDDEFERVSEYIESLDSEDEEDDDKE